MRPAIAAAIVTLALLAASPRASSAQTQVGDQQAPQPPPGVYVVPLDGGRPVRVGGPLATAVWSPDGTALAVVETPAAGGLTIVRAGSGEAIPVPGTTDAIIGTPRWSPDGSRLAYSVLPNRPADRQPGLYVVPASGQGPLRISPTIPTDFVWTPDGSGLTLVQQTTAAGPASQVENTVVTLDASTGATQAVILPASGSICPRDPVWSPDGASLAYFVGGVQNDPCVNPDARGLWVWDAATGTSRQIAQGTGLGLHWLSDGTILVQFTGLAIYRPDGTLVRTLVEETGSTLADAPVQVGGGVALYSRTTCTRAAAYVVDLGGGVPEQLSDYSVYAYTPRLAPAGDRAAWSAESAAGADLVVVALDATGATVALSGAPGMSVIGWSPVGDAVAVSIQSMPVRPFFCGD